MVSGKEMIETYSGRKTIGNRVDKLFYRVQAWWRGYSHDDVYSAWQKLEGIKMPGEITFLTEKEMYAMKDYNKRWHRL